MQWFLNPKSRADHGSQIHKTAFTALRLRNWLCDLDSYSPPGWWIIARLMRKRSLRQIRILYDFFLWNMRIAALSLNLIHCQVLYFGDYIQ